MCAFSLARIFALAGLAWGMAFGFLDALPTLLEGDSLQHLGRRLLALLFVMMWTGLAFGLVLGAAGLVGGLALRPVRRRASGREAAAVAFGLSAALSTAAYGWQRYPGGSPVLIVGLALLAGLGVGAMVRKLARQELPAKQAPPAQVSHHPYVLRITHHASRITHHVSPLRVTLYVALAGLAVLLAVAVLRPTVGNLKMFNPRVTGQSPTAERPNIVLISIDALRADRLGAYGNRPSPSPRIDELAGRGVVFDQAISQGSSTVHAVASFLTSLYPTELGMIAGRPWAVDPERVTLAEALQAGGYRTQAYVANGHLVPAKGYAQGFDGFVPPEPDRPYDLDRLRDRTVAAGLACRGSTSAPLCRLFDRAYSLLFDPPLAMEDEGRRISTRALRFIRLHRDEQFFLWLHYMEPHAAYSPSEPFGQVPSGVNEEALRAWQPSNKTVPIIIGDRDRQALWALYDGEIRDVDRLVGQVWDQIAAQGLADRTLLVITADHGDEFYDHGDYGHGHSVYQEVLHVPLIFVGPQVQAGRTVDAPVPMLALLPTLVDAAGAPMPEPVRGQSLLPVLRGGDMQGQVFYSQSPARRASYDYDALYEGTYKLIYNPQRDRAELYDLQADPREQRDLAAADAPRAEAMRAELRAWAAEALQTWAALPQSGTEAGEVDQAMEEALRKIGY